MCIVRPRNMVTRLLRVQRQDGTSERQARLPSLRIDTKQQLAQLLRADSVVPPWWRRLAQRFPRVADVLHVVGVVNM